MYHLFRSLLEPVYPEYMPPEDDVLPAEEQPLHAAASPTTESPGYIPESDPDEDDEEDPEEDPADYPADKGDGGDDEESSDDDDDVEEDEEDKDEEEEEEEHLAPADPTAVAFPVDQDPSVEETEPFETDESTATPPSPPHPTYRVTARMSIRPQAPTSFFFEKDAESPTYSEAPLGFRAVGVRQRDTPPSPVHETKILEICLPLCKRPCRTAPTPGYEVGESSAAGAARQDGPAVARADIYGFVDMVDAALGRQMSSELGYGGWHHVFPVGGCTGGPVSTKRPRLSRAAWAQSMDACNQTRSEGISLRTTVMAQQSEITELQEADRRRQSVISDLLNRD
ncbi:hypothetical protein Tco_0155346 [Tanacetum coccineum]